MRSRTCSQVCAEHLSHTYRVLYTDEIDVGYESTFVDAPETPAHQFALKAFKHAVFGTPSAGDAINTVKKLQKKLSPDVVAAKHAPKDVSGPSSPSKQPGGILMTPGTAAKGRKTVSFGAQVVDNEGKRGNVSRSGIPNDCPGKFPSPWTPGTELKTDENSESQRPRTKLTAALMDARTTTQPRSSQKPKARDDSDITMDLSAPRSSSGKYWKAQYDSYKERSEKEVKKLIAKQQLAKNYAKKKDDDFNELSTKLEQERRRYRRREQELEQQNKDLQERLRQSMEDKLSTGIEITTLKSRIATLEMNKSSAPEQQESKPMFEIFEDSSKDTRSTQSQPERDVEASYLSQKARAPSFDKENSPPKSRHTRRQTVQESSLFAHPSSAKQKIGLGDDQVSVILGKPVRTSTREADPVPNLIKAQPSPESVLHTPLSVRKSDGKELNIIAPQSPAPIMSSPLPQPTPERDTWMNADESSVGQIDRMAIPIGGGGGSYDRPSRNNQGRRHGTSTSMPRASKTERLGPAYQATDTLTDMSKVEQSAIDARVPDQRQAMRASSKLSQTATAGVIEKKFIEKARSRSIFVLGSKPDLSHLMDDSSRTKRKRTLPFTEDRKAAAKNRLEARKQRKHVAN